MVHVDNIKVTSITDSSAFDIGDVAIHTPVSQVLAVQKEGGVHSEEGFAFKNFPIFDRTTAIAPTLTEIHQQTNHHDSNIYVDNVNIIGISTSSAIQVGSVNNIDAEARVKQIRILK